MANEAADLDPINALDNNQIVSHDGVLATPGANDCAVTVGSGTLGATDTLSVAAGTALVDGAETSVGAQNVSIAEGDPDPRKDVVFVDATGTVSVVQGTPEDPRWSEHLAEAQRTLSNAYRPAPSDMTATTGTVLAVVYVAEGATSIATGDVEDRRVFAKRERVDAVVTNSEEASIGQLNNTVHTLGPAVENEYQSLATALSDLSALATSSNHHTIFLTGPITETGAISIPSYVDVEGNGHRITIEGELDSLSHVALKAGDIAEATWRNLTIDYAPTSDPTDRSAVYRSVGSVEDSITFNDVTFLGADTTSADAWGVWTRHHSKGRFVNCTAVARGSGNRSHAWRTDHNSAPELIGCIGQSGNQSQAAAAFDIRGSSTPQLEACYGYGSGTQANNYGIWINEAAAPSIVGCYGGPYQQVNRMQKTGTVSFSPVNELDGDGPLESPRAVNMGDAALLAMHLRVVTPATGATIDIDSPAADFKGIARNIDAETAGRKQFDIEHVFFNVAAGHEITVTPSDASVEWTLRWTVIGALQGFRGLNLATVGSARIAGSHFRGNFRQGSAGYISDAAKGGDQGGEKWSITNCLFENPAGNESDDGIALEAQSDSGKFDPIRNCTTVGDTLNVNPEDESLTGSYTGDGTQGRAITTEQRPDIVYVEGSDGTLYEVRDDNLSPINGTTPAGELSISNTGFTVGDNAADADPNTNTEIYQYRVVLDSF